MPIGKSWQPLHDRVLVERIPPKPGFIVLTDIQTIRWAQVVAIGPQVDPSLKVGDVVMLPGIAAEEPDFAMGQLIMVMEGDIGCKVS
jgi:co-chaperonin GroES (HSP10)